MSESLIKRYNLSEGDFWTMKFDNLLDKRL